MKKKISFSTQGQRADIGHITIYRMLPNRYADAIGPFVFLDHFGPTRHAVNEPIQKNGNGAHPHRGIATLTYILNGEEEHFDSKGNYAKIHSGGVQWMKAGRLAGSSVSFRNSVACSSVGLPKTTGMLK